MTASEAYIERLEREHHEAREGLRFLKAEQEGREMMVRFWRIVGLTGWGFAVILFLTGIILLA